VKKTATSKWYAFERVVLGKTCESQKYLHPDKDKQIVMEIIETTIRNTHPPLYAGAGSRVFAQLPKLFMDKEMFLAELLKAFEREARLYF